MDLRKLRTEEVSEVVRQKKLMRAALPYIILVLIIIAIVGSGFGIYQHYKFKQMEKEPIKVYKAVSPPIQEKRDSVPPSASPLVFTTDTDTT